MNEKLAAHYFGSFEIIARIGKGAYKFQPPSSRIHNVFHVSHLRKAIGNLKANPQVPNTLTRPDLT